MKLSLIARIDVYIIDGGRSPLKERPLVVLGLYLCHSEEGKTNVDHETTAYAVI